MIDFGFVFSLLYAVGKGFGLHGHDIEPGNEVLINKSIYVFNLLYVSLQKKQTYWYYQVYMVNLIFRSSHQQLLKAPF